MYSSYKITYNRKRGIKGGIVVLQPMYVHIDSVSNHVLSSHLCFDHQAIQYESMPKNILLLKGRSQLATYDDFTGFYYIKDAEKIIEFMEDVTRELVSYNWIDFESMEFLHQLTPQEIADLLYISHANTHLHSPFFYKLQNNFIYLNLGQGFSKVYYRKMDVFYQLLSNRITKGMSEALTMMNKRLFFTKEKKAQPLSIDLVRELVPYLKVGMVFSFERIEYKDNHYYLPLFLAEDRYHVIESTLTQDNKIGRLLYTEENGWQLELEEELFI